MDEQTLRRIIREELDNYDRDKGVTPRMSSNGVRAGSFYGIPFKVNRSVPPGEAHFKGAEGAMQGKITDI